MNECKICNKHCIFFVWSSSRPFPKEKLLSILAGKSLHQSEDAKKSIMNDIKQGMRICIFCYKEHFDMEI